MKVPYISATRLKMAKDCSFAYEQQYDPKSDTARVLKKKSNHAGNTQAARLGNIIHGALEDWRMPDETGKTPPPKFGRLMKLYDDWCEKPQFAVDFDFYQDGKVLLRRWFDRRGKDPIRVYATEQAMGSHANPFMLDNGVPIYGFIDLIVEHKNGAIEVIDYKSNRAPKTQEEADSDVQAGIYLSWAKQMFPDREVRFSFEMLRFGVVTTIWDNKKLENFKAWLKTQYESIKSKTEGTPEIGDGCRWCAYTTICPAAQDLMTKGAFDLVEHEFGSDEEMLNGLATIKAAQGILTRRRGSIEREFKDRLDPFNTDDKIITDGWSVELVPKTREEYIPSELQKILPPAVFGQITKVTKAAVEKALPILPENVAQQVRDSSIRKPYNAFSVKRRDIFKDKPKDE
tara:strand:- start:632 stop:1834 length:1203 start_codon:yes stop_codon:yes gene_type:complete